LDFCYLLVSLTDLIPVNGWGSRAIQKEEKDFKKTFVRASDAIREPFYSHEEQHSLPTHRPASSSRAVESTKQRSLPSSSVTVEREKDSLREKKTEEIVALPIRLLGCST